MIRQTALITGSLAGMLTIVGWLSGRLSWIAALWLGAAWGVVNAWCLAQVARVVFAGERRWRVVAWLLVKFLGLYAVAAWLLVGLRLHAGAWLIGFTVSLIGFGIATWSTKQPPILQKSPT